ncbi:atg31 super family [Kluyveromyces marxianus]|uniref:Autophagy-related protein 31 n=1 Tax=Kluyveromyces marxianus (strain DMKU3-1042 / BCC 29191 / NBRC 104275) TaxID=1003335 RepID=ATG31_KLUMD|nr:atg31 super family [Kluyveromyces marxianus DMKU3-1042]W0T3G1.1 RecName: Full=Autophagy-related protein 31 [Kluyveromyces marxianus DMKU3-1042]BAO38147.1 atg31 super family [Kluyveromyces marxianus DMKU3-1042]BAP69715.1 atg31 super family [Kluyveromyces marxianus]
MDTPMLLVTNVNDAIQNDDLRMDSLTNENAWFLNNISYIFEDDEPIQQEDHSNYENLFIIDSDLNGKISGVELLSEKWQLLSYDQNKPYNCISLRVMDELRADLSPQDGDVKDLDSLARRYHDRNVQIRNLLDSLIQED